MNRAGRDAGQDGLQRPLLEHRGDVEVAGRAERLGAQELVDPGRPLGAEEGPGQAGAEHRLGAVGDPAPAGSGRRPGGGSISRSCPRSLYSGAIPRAEVDHVVVEERVAGLDRGIHRDAVPLGDHQEAGEHHLVADVERLVERMPAADPVVGDVEVGVGAVIARAAATSTRNRGSAWTGRSSRTCPAGPVRTPPMACSGGMTMRRPGDRPRRRGCGARRGTARPTVR